MSAIDTVGFSLTEWAKAPVDFVSRNVKKIEPADVAKIFVTDSQRQQIEYAQKTMADAERRHAAALAAQKRKVRTMTAAQKKSALAAAKLRAVLAHLKKTDPPKYRAVVARILRKRAQLKRAARLKAGAAKRVAKVATRAPSLSRRGRAELKAKHMRAARGFLVSADGRIQHGNWRAA